MCNIFREGCSFINEVISHMSLPLVVGFINRTFLGQINGSAGYFVFREIAFLGDLFYRMTIIIACSKIHERVQSTNILTKLLLYYPQGFSKLRQSIFDKNRKLLMLLLMESWSAAC